MPVVHEIATEATTNLSYKGHEDHKAGIFVISVPFVADRLRVFRGDVYGEVESGLDP